MMMTPHQPPVLRRRLTTEVYYEDHQYPRGWHYLMSAAWALGVGLMLLFVGVGQASTSIAVAVPAMSVGLVLIAVGGVIIANELRGQGMQGLRVDSDGIHYRSHGGLIKLHIPVGVVLGLGSVSAKMRDSYVPVKVTGHSHVLTPRSTEAFRTAVSTMLAMHEPPATGNIGSRTDRGAFYTETRAGHPRRRVAALITGLGIVLVALIWAGVTLGATRLVEPDRNAWPLVSMITVLLFLTTAGVGWVMAQTRAIDYEHLLISDTGITLAQNGGTLIQTIDPALITGATAVQLFTGQRVALVQFENGRTLRIQSANPDTLAAAIEVARRDADPATSDPSRSSNR